VYGAHSTLNNPVHSMQVKSYCIEKYQNETFPTANMDTAGRFTQEKICSCLCRA